MQHEHADAGQRRRIGHTMQVDEAGVAHHAVIGVEDEKGRDIDHEAQTQAHGHLPELLRQFKAAVLEVIDEKS